MFKVLSKAGLSLTLAGGIAVAGFQPSSAPSTVTNTYDPELAHYVGAAPEFAETAKKLGIDISGADPAEETSRQPWRKVPAVWRQSCCRTGRQRVMFLSWLSSQSIKMVTSQLATLKDKFPRNTMRI